MPSKEKIDRAKVMASLDTICTKCGGVVARISTGMGVAGDAILFRVVSFDYMDLANSPRRLIVLAIAASLLFVVRGMTQLPPEPQPIISFSNGRLLIVG